MNSYKTQPITVDAGDKRIAEEIFFQRFPQVKAKNIRLLKVSYDARRKNQIKKVLTFAFDSDSCLDGEEFHSYENPINVLDIIEKSNSARNVLVVGAGPSGLFASLALATSGISVTLIDRGGNVNERQTAIDSLTLRRQVNPDTNVQFGLGGAGTFSDGKLTTGINSPYTFTVFDTFVKLGAPEEILTSSTPHIGTDNLRVVIENFAQKLTQTGVKIFLNTRLVGLKAKNNGWEVETISTKNTSRASQKDYFDKVLLCSGHSARDIYAMLDKMGVNLQPKAFSMGVRVEHDREFINSAQYGANYDKSLPTADYKLATTVSGRGVYTFCMCPGGVVISSGSSDGEIVTNGMSNYDRMAKNSNSALLVSVTPDDYFSGNVLDGVSFQQKYEQLCFVAAGSNYNAPSQNVVDFAKDRLTTKFDLAPSYLPSVKSVRLSTVLPPFVTSSLKGALPIFDNKIHGFASSGVMTAIESRSSSPVRILRNEQGQTNFQNLYPVGEGAGYAGGIVSAAADGIKIAMQIIKEK